MAMNSKSWFLGVVIVGIHGVLGGCRTPPEDKGSESILRAVVAPEERMQLIEKAVVRDPRAASFVGTKSLALGPVDSFFDEPEKELVCDFVEPDPSDIPGGRTPKFNCLAMIGGKQKELKIKYDQAFQEIDGKTGVSNREVYGEVLATRLLWAAGFGADRIYTAKVKCKNCPRDPWTYIRKKLNLIDVQDRFIEFVRFDLISKDTWAQKLPEVDFKYAVVEIKYPAKKITSATGEIGWKWEELYQHMAEPRIQSVDRDTLTIMAAFIDHMDNKAAQQRLVCLEGKADHTCKKPMLMVQDAGSSFGNGWAPFQGDFKLNKMDLDKWVKLSLWADKGRCLVQIHGAPNASFRTTWKVTDEARAQLAETLADISDEQLFDLFESARVGVGSINNRTSEQWLEGFKLKLKRDLIDARCGDAPKVRVVPRDRNAPRDRAEIY